MNILIWRAWNFERKLEKRKGGELAMGCLREMRKRAKNSEKMSNWDREREEFFRAKGVGVKEIGKNEGEGGEMWERVERKEKELQVTERWEKIGESRYNT